MEAYPQVFAGSHRVTESLVAELPARGWRARVVLPADGVAAERFRDAGVRVEVVPAPPALLRYQGASLRGRPAVQAAAAIPAYWRRLGDVLRTADVVHALDPRGLLLAGPAARVARRPLVWQLHTTSRWAAVNALGSVLAHEVVVVSASSRRAMPGLRGRVVVEEPPVTEVVRDLPVTVPGLDPLVATVARAHQNKGLDVLVEAVAHLSDRWPALRVVVIGADPSDGGEVTRDLAARIGGHGLGDRVTLAGWADRPTDAWAGAWAYVQPSRTGESYGMAVVEAMACSLPVVVTDVPGLCERVADGRDGMVVPPEDPVALAGAIDALLAEPDRARRMGDAGRRRVRDGRSVGDHADSWVRRYEALASP